MDRRHYWPVSAGGRMSRRRALIGSGLSVGSAAILAACGSSGSDDKGTGKRDRSGLLSAPEDTSKQAKRGGTLKLSTPSIPPSYEPNLAFTGGGGQTIPHSRLTRAEPGYLKPATRNVIGDVAESWEWSPDRLQITMKLRSDVRFHPLPPVNGRTLDVDDVLFSWARLKRVGTIRSEFANDINPGAPIVSLTAPDARTVVIKLAQPVVYLLSMLAHASALPMLPKEMDSQFDPKQQVISSGPFYLSEYKPSIGVTFKRHPFYHYKDFPFVDQLDMPLIPEYATGLAQFRSGSIYTYAVRPEDVLAVKRDVPEMLLYKSEMTTIGGQTIFGWQGNSPFKDERVRQAYSMLMDRDLIIEVARNVSKFTSEGLPVETRWNSNLQCTFDGWWLDPQSKDFGPNAKYFVRNVPEAKRLMAAAGYASGVDIISSHITTNEYGTDFPKMVEVVEGMMAEGGFRFKKNIVNYASEFIPRYRDGKGNFEGLSYKRGPTPPADDAVAYLMFFNYSQGGVAFYGYDANGKGDNSGDRRSTISFSKPGAKSIPRSARG